MNKSRSASPVLFGFDFQTNAAIILMIENMAAMKTIRVEGEEDIEIQLNNGSYVLAQAKAVVDSSTDFRNVRANSKKALRSLSEAAERLNVNKLVYITNSPNPFNDEASKPMFYEDAHVLFDNLPRSTKDMVSGWFEDPLETSKLSIQVLPFETDEDKQRYKVVLRVISDFIGELELDIDGLRKKLHEVWTTALNKNGTRKDASLKLHKKDIVWPIIVFVTGRGKLGRDAQYCNLLDDGAYEELSRTYGEIIDYYCERYDFATKIVSDFSASGIKGRDAIVDFIDAHWDEYLCELDTRTMDESIKSSLIKVIMFNVLAKRYDIDKIKRATRL